MRRSHRAGYSVAAIVIGAVMLGCLTNLSVTLEPGSTAQHVMLRIGFTTDTAQAVRGLLGIRVITCSTEHNVERPAVWEMRHIGPSNGLGPRVVTLGQPPSNEWTTTGTVQPLAPGCYTVYVDAGGAQGAITLDVRADGTVHS
jgi:hypothetical protein